MSGHANSSEQVYGFYCQLTKTFFKIPDLQIYNQLLEIMRNAKMEDNSNSEELEENGEQQLQETCNDIDEVLKQLNTGNEKQINKNLKQGQD